MFGLFAFWQLYFSQRPVSRMDSAILEGDGSYINYCQLPVLDDTSYRAKHLPKGHTPGCSYEQFPMPIIGACTEPLAYGVVDIRGLWKAVEGDRVDHVERIEQCGARTVITAAGVIHDSGPNSTEGLPTNDTEGGITFSIGNRQYCPRSSANMVWKDNILNFHLLEWGPVVVKRYMDGEQLVWEYADGSITRMERICSVPEEHRTPQPRGRRIQLL